MRFRLMSDLHLEFHSQVTDFAPTPLPEDKDTVLILAGDISTGTSAFLFLQEVCKQFHSVVYILGNHEFYGHEFTSVLDAWKKANGPANLHFLHNNVVTIGDVRIFGGTLWTSFNNSEYFAMQRAKQGMNDYHIIHIDDNGRQRRLLPDDTVNAHKETMLALKQTLAQPFDGKTVVVTHHLPHLLSVHQDYRGHPLNPAYMTDLDDVIRDNKIDVWCHGHTHSSVDVEVHGTRILCNPRGYFPRDLNKDFDDELTFDL